MSRVRMDVYCGGDGWGCDTLIATYYDVVWEKYPFYCPTCEMTTEGKWPFMIKATVEEETDAGS